MYSKSKDVQYGRGISSEQMEMCFVLVKFLVSTQGDDLLLRNRFKVLNQLLLKEVGDANQHFHELK